MDRHIVAGLALLVAGALGTSWAAGEASAQDRTDEPPVLWGAGAAVEPPAFAVVGERVQADLEAMERFRPGYAFWQHIFLVPDGAVAFGSAADGRLLAVFRNGSDWTRAGQWEDPELAGVLAGRDLPSRLNLRRDEVAELLEARVGPVVHNATRGRFLLPNARRYGPFLEEWAAIYERFGVPGELGLAQAVVESGLNGRVRSEARALGLCQWLPSNWEKMKRLDPTVIEGYNQTTQAAYCAAHLSILSVMYGSFIPALSEHHAGGTNVGRTVINGDRLGGMDIREKYFLGAEFARDLRTISSARFRDVVRTYGPRSYLYAEMVFGNVYTIQRIQAETPQVRIHAMRTPRNIALTEITRRTGLSVDEVRRFNPALVRQAPRGANLYLPQYDETFGPDVAFWHRAPDPAYLRVMEDFVRLDAAPEDWQQLSFRPILAEFRRRFAATGSEEGRVMSTALGYMMDALYTSRRSVILAEFRTDPRIQQLVEEGIVARRLHQTESAVAR